MTRPKRAVLIYSPYVLGCIFEQSERPMQHVSSVGFVPQVTDIFEDIVSELQVWTVPGTQNPDETSPQKQHKRQPAVVRYAPNLDSMEKKLLKTTATQEKPTRLGFNYVHKITHLQEIQLVRPACDHKVVLTHLCTVLFLFHVIRSRCIPHHHGYERADIALLHDHLPQ